MKTPRLLTHSLAAFLANSPLFAAPYTWDGGSLVDNNIATAANWSPDGAPPSDLVNTNLAFDGIVRTTPNFSAVFSASSVTFNNNAAANPFTFTGSGLTIGTTGIVNNDANPATLSIPVTLGTASTTFNAASGALTFNSIVALGTGTLNVNGGQATTATFGVSGTGLINKTGAGTLTLPNGTLSADVTVAGGSVAVNSAATTIFDSNSVVAVNSGSFLANGNVTLNGAQLTRSAGGVVSLAAGKTLTIQNGGDAIISGGFIQYTAATINVTGAGSTFALTGSSGFLGGSTLNITAGGSVSNIGYTDLAFSGGNATLLVDGPGSSFSSSATSYWGYNGNAATVTFAIGATGSIGDTDIAQQGAGTVGTVRVQSGSSLTVGGLSLANTTDAATATFTVDGTNSVVTQTAGAGLTIGAASGSSGTLNVQSGGTFNASATGNTTINATGTLAITGGIFNANGNLFVNGRLTRDVGGSFNLAAGKTLTVLNGGDAVISGSYNQTTAATITVAGAGSTFTTSGASEFRGGSTLNITAGGRADSSGHFALANTGGNATVLVDGAGSSLAAGAGTFSNSLWGYNGNTAAVTFSNGGSGTFSSGIQVATSSAGSVGTILVQSGSSLTVGNGLMLATTSTAVNATLTVDGPGSLVTLSAGSPLTMGAASGSIATLNVQNGGTFTASSVSLVNATGTLAIAGGTFNAIDDMFLNGQLTCNVGDAFNLAAGKTLTIQAGGDATFTGSYFQSTAATINVAGAGSTFTMSDTSEFRGGCTLNIIAGGSVSNSAGPIHLATSGGNATVLVDGAGSSFSAPSGSYWGLNGNTATITFANGATGSIGSTAVASGGAGSVGTVRVQSGSTLTMGHLTLAAGTASTTASFTVDGADSTATQAGSSLLYIGSESGSTATLAVANGGTFTSGAGAVYLFSTGTITIDGGTVNLAGPLQRNGGVVNFNTGALSIIDNFTVGTGGLLGTNLTLDATRHFTTSATTTIGLFRTLTLNGGTLSTGALVNNGTLAFTAGTLTITGAAGLNVGTGALGASVALGFGANLQVTNTAAIAAGASVTLNGGTFTAGTLNNSGTLRANLGTATAFSGTNSGGGRMFLGDTLNVSGALTNALGARITLEDGTGLLAGLGALTNAGLLTGAGTVLKALTNGATGEVRGESGKTLFFSGAATNSGTFNLLGGTLDFADGVTNSATGTITGFGTFRSALLTNHGNLGLSGNTRIDGDVTNTAGARIITSGGSTTTFYDDVIHNGSEIRTSAGGATVFFGAVSGAGPFTGTGTVYFEGDLRPGNSPAVVTFSPQIVFSPSNVLTVELGGRVAGTGYDKLVFTNTGASQLTWGGTLVIELINGFTPAAGDAFDVFDFDPARATGTFGAITVVTNGLLPPGLAFDTSELHTTGILRVVSTTGTTFSQWAATALGNPGALPGGDHDGDGSLNLMEYALALYPVVPGTFAPIGELHSYPDGTRLRLRFWRPLDRSDITIRVQGSADLATWDDLAVSVNSAPFTGAGFVSENRVHPAAEPGLVEVRDILTPSAAAHRFLRTVVTLSP